MTHDESMEMLRQKRIQLEKETEYYSNFFEGQKVFLLKTNRTGEYLVCKWSRDDNNIIMVLSKSQADKFNQLVDNIVVKLNPADIKKITGGQTK